MGDDVEGCPEDRVTAARWRGPTSSQPPADSDTSGEAEALVATPDELEVVEAFEPIVERITLAHSS